MSQVLVISKKYYEKINNQENIEIINKQGYSSADDLIWGIIKKLNDNYTIFNITTFRFFTDGENKKYNMYSAFIDNFVDKDYNRAILSFSPIESKLGNTIISQELMPLINREIKDNIAFLLDKRIKKIFILTSQVNISNVIKDDDGNTLQLNVNILNTMGFDVIPFFRIKGLSTDSSFSNLGEYLSFLNDLRKSKSTNDQTEYIYIKDNVVYGQCERYQIKGQFPKFFTFRYYAAILLGGNDFKYDIRDVTKHKVGGSHFEILDRFVNFANNNEVVKFESSNEVIEDSTPINEDEYLDITRVPEAQTTSVGRRYKTKRAIREKAINERNNLCDCHDNMHFYFESSQTLENYVEGHHIIPMNRQETYWNDYKINLDVVLNIIPLCPNCHTQVHNGSRAAKLQILSEIYTRNEKELKAVDKNITFNRLVSFYNIAISKEEEIYYLKYGLKVFNTKKQLNLS